MSNTWWFQVLQPETLVILFIFGGGLIVAIVGLLSSAWKGNRENERLSILKQQMIEKGMSADEIVRVIQAGPAPEE